MEEKLHRYMFSAAFKVEDSNNFESKLSKKEIKEILNCASCGQLFEGGMVLVGWFGFGLLFFCMGVFFRKR